MDKPTAAQRELLSGFVRAKRAIAEASEYVEKNKGAVLSIVRLLGGQAKALNGLLLEGKYVYYEYPAAIKRREDKLKQDKKVMQLDGRANQITNPIVQFRDLQKPSATD